MAFLTWPMFVAADSNVSRFDVDSSSFDSNAEKRPQVDDTKAGFSARLQSEFDALLDEWKTEINAEKELDVHSPDVFVAPRTWDPLENPIIRVASEIGLNRPPGMWSEPGASLDQPFPKQHWTTMMIRKLPKNFSLEKLMRLLDSEGLRGAYDLLYVPRDMKTHKNFNYCFVNFAGRFFAEEAMRRFNGYTLGAEVLSTQWITEGDGLKAQIEKLRNKPMMHPDVPKEFKPVLFRKGIPIEFPGPTQDIDPTRFGRQKG